MKKIYAEEGVKINPVYLLNKIADINETNFREVIDELFTPGLFLHRKADASFDDDFATELVLPYTVGGTDYQSIKVKISEAGLPARAYTDTGKVISLYAPFTITPSEEGATDDGSYGLYLKPSTVAIEKANYLPNYTVGNEMKDLVQEYMVDFVIVKSIEVVPSESVLIATFTLSFNGTSYVLSDLVDKRYLGRVYLNEQLYDFYPSDFLKHDYVIAPGALGVGLTTHDIVGEVKYGDDETLCGTLTLYAAKNPNSRVNVIFDGSNGYPIVEFPNSTEIYVLFISLTLNDFYSANVINTPLLVMNATLFTPDADKIVLGVRSVNAIPISSLIPVGQGTD